MRVRGDPVELSGGRGHPARRDQDSRDALTCGCYPFLHATETTDHVAEEHVVFAVTFACAMVRREVYERLGGLDDCPLPQLLRRRRHPGTCPGDGMAESLLRHARRHAPRVEDTAVRLGGVRVPALHGRHAEVISHWKLRGFTLSPQAWPAPEPKLPASAGPVAAQVLSKRGASSAPAIQARRRAQRRPQEVARARALGAEGGHSPDPALGPAGRGCQTRRPRRRASSAIPTGFRFA